MRGNELWEILLSGALNSGLLDRGSIYVACVNVFLYVYVCAPVSEGPMFDAGHGVNGLSP